MTVNPLFYFCLEDRITLHSVFDQFFKYKKSQALNKPRDDELGELEEQSIKALIWYISMQEIARQVSLSNK